MDCLYAAVNMVCKFHVEGPRNGVPGAWMANNGLPFDDFATLAKGEHLIALTLANGYDLTDTDLARFLGQWGPI